MPIHYLIKASHLLKLFCSVLAQIILFHFAKGANCVMLYCAFQTDLAKNVVNMETTNNSMHHKNNIFQGVKSQYTQQGAGVTMSVLIMSKKTPHMVPITLLRL